MPAVGTVFRDVLGAALLAVYLFVPVFIAYRLARGAWWLVWRIGWVSRGPGPLPRVMQWPGRAWRVVYRGLEWLAVWYFRLLMWLLWLVLVWPVQWLGRELKPGERIRPDIDWPRLYARDGTYTVIADYRAPPRKGWAKGLGLIAAGMMAVYRLDHHPEWQLDYVGPGIIIWPTVLTGIGVGWLVYLNFRRLRLRISESGLRWRESGGRRCFVPPADMADLEIVVLPQHSRAQDEQDTDNLRRKVSRPVYRIASETVLHFGYRKRNTRQIAEIHRDRNGWKAKHLQTGVHAALEEFYAEFVRRQAQADLGLRSLD